MGLESSSHGAQPDYAVHYRKWHRGDSNHIDDMLDFYARILLPQLPKEKNARILDVGCGMGFALLLLKRLGYESLKGVERDLSQATEARRHGLDVDLANDTAEYLRQKKGFFDCVVCLDVIEHMHPSDQIAFISAIHSCLMPGGKFVATVPNANSTLASRWRYIDWTHRTSFTEASLEFLLKAGGFADPMVLASDVKQFYKSASSRKLAPIAQVLRGASRMMRRIDLIGELGWDEGLSLPISVNLMAVARRS